MVGQGHLASQSIFFLGIVFPSLMGTTLNNIPLPTVTVCIECWICDLSSNNAHASLNPTTCSCYTMWLAILFKILSVFMILLVINFVQSQSQWLYEFRSQQHGPTSNLRNKNVAYSNTWEHACKVCFEGTNTECMMSTSNIMSMNECVATNFES